MPKPKFKRMKTFHKKVQVPSKRHNKHKDGNPRTPRGTHLDHSPCSLYCSCMVLNTTSNIEYKQNELLIGDYGEFLDTIHFLLNSKIFMEFLCTCRHYIHAYNASKKCYYLTVLSSTLRDIAMASIHHQSSYDITRFLQYCLKWVPELNRTRITRFDFLSFYMSKIHSELNHLNVILFKQWCGLSLLQESTFHPLQNPLQLILQKPTDNVLTTKGVYSLTLPIQVSTRVARFSELGRLSLEEIPPTICITSSLLQQQARVVRWSDVLLLTCSSTNHALIPSFIVLPGKNGDSAGVYSIRSMGGEGILYKRLFPSKYHFAMKRKIYDVHKSGLWIRMQKENVSEISWDDVQRVPISWVHYERVFHSSI